jgi:hypothetical protein
MTPRFIQRRRERQAAEADAELRALLGDEGYAELNDPAQRARLLEQAAAERRERDKYWDQFYALSTWQQIRRRGVTHWMCNTNKGGMFSLVAGLLITWLAVHLGL